MYQGLNFLAPALWLVVGLAAAISGFIATSKYQDDDGACYNEFWRNEEIARFSMFCAVVGVVVVIMAGWVLLSRLRVVLGW
jgi:multisubunit Na+/H+ antiporter MnhB subunit